jgi:hypothetical protein
VTGDWRKVLNVELHNCNPTNIIGLNQSSKMRWARHVARIGEMIRA